MESVLESHGPRESLELSIVHIRLETAELQRTKCKSCTCRWGQVGAQRALAARAAGRDRAARAAGAGDCARQSRSAQLDEARDIWTLVETREKRVSKISDLTLCSIDDVRVALQSTHHSYPNRTKRLPRDTVSKQKRKSTPSSGGRPTAMRNCTKSRTRSRRSGQSWSATFPISKRSPRSCAFTTQMKTICTRETRLPCTRVSLSREREREREKEREREREKDFSRSLS